MIKYKVMRAMHDDINKCKYAIQSLNSTNRSKEP